MAPGQQILQGLLWGWRASPASWPGRRGSSETTGDVGNKCAHTHRKLSHLCSLIFPLFCRVPLPQAPGLWVRRCHLWPDKLLQPWAVHRLVLLLDSQQGPPQWPRLWVSPKIPPWGALWAGVGGLGTPGREGTWGSSWERAVVEDMAELMVSPQVCMALQVPGQWAVAADWPEGGEGDLRNPHTRALWRWWVDDQVQHAIPHRWKPQLGLLQGPNWEQQGWWTLHFGYWCRGVCLVTWMRKVGRCPKRGFLWEQPSGWDQVPTPCLGAEQSRGIPPVVRVSATLTSCRRKK